jgi:hypothetical protein
MAMLAGGGRLPILHKTHRQSSLPLIATKIFELNPAGFYAAFREFAALNASLLIRTYAIVILLNVLSLSSRSVLLSWHTRPHSIQ